METLTKVPTDQISNNQTPNPELAAPDRPPSPAEPPPTTPVLVAPGAATSALPANPEKPAPADPQPIRPPLALKPRAPIPRNLGVGTADIRTPAEDIQFQECEALMSDAWRHFAGRARSDWC